MEKVCLLDRVVNRDPLADPTLKRPLDCVAYISSFSS